MFLPKDFIQTAQGLLFAVVVAGVEENKVRCFLRYVRHENGQWLKMSTDQANALLTAHYPFYCFHSPSLDAFLHGVSLDAVTHHHRPTERLTQLLHEKNHDAIEKDCVGLCRLFEAQGVDLSKVGVTGSLLISQQNANSDIDLVCYDLPTFTQCRVALGELLAKHTLTDLSETDWQASYERRDCDLDFDSYVWHERRKFNKALINGRKFDLSLVEPQSISTISYRKCGAMMLSVLVKDDARAFCYPAEFQLAHPRIQSVVCFTATYTGQAMVGETIEIAGMLEEDEHGNQRIVVGSSREAQGEYIKVIRT
jgi:predicted nucleotidyltransferase